MARTRSRVLGVCGHHARDVSRGSMMLAQRKSLRRTLPRGRARRCEWCSHSVGRESRHTCKLGLIVWRLTYLRLSVAFEERNVGRQVVVGVEPGLTVSEGSKGSKMIARSTSNDGDKSRGPQCACPSIFAVQRFEACERQAFPSAKSIPDCRAVDGQEGDRGDRGARGPTIIWVPRQTSCSQGPFRLTSSKAGSSRLVSGGARGPRGHESAEWHSYRLGAIGKRERKRKKIFRCAGRGRDTTTGSSEAAAGRHGGARGGASCRV